jgi:hypothetical protein
VPDGDLFYLVVEGPSVVTQLSASASTLAIGDRLVPGTGTSATNDDAGRVAKQDLTGATATLGNNIQNALGFAGEANAAVVNAKVKIGPPGPSDDPRVGLSGASREGDGCKPVPLGRFIRHDRAIPCPPGPLS